MRKSVQRGGNDMPSSMPFDLKLDSPSSTSSYASDPFVVSGGGKKRKSVKKPVAKTAASKKKGGALVDDIKNLAVPFAILLAKEGLDTMFSKKSKAAKKPAMSASKGKVSSGRKASASGGSSGGECGSCSRVATGGKGKMSRYAQLSKEIDEFLSKSN